MTFPNEQAMVNHNQRAHPGAAMQAHAGHEHFTCGACGMSFHAREELMQHSKAAHPM
jgi:hypothetical protein